MRLKRRLIYLALLALPYGQVSASPWPEANPDNVATAIDKPLTIAMLNNDVGDGLSLNGQSPLLIPLTCPIPTPLLFQP